MSKILKSCVVGIAVGMLLGGTAAAQKFAFVDSEKIKQNYKEWKKAEETFDTEFSAWEEEAAEMETELRQLIQDYEKQKLILSAEKKLEREAAIGAKEEALNTFTREISAPGGKAERRMNELVRPLYERIQAAIEKVAIEENYDFIFNSAGLAYAKKELDITDKVIEILESED
jgi:outer membrane protein